MICSPSPFAAVAKCVRAIASQEEGWVFDSQPRQTEGSDSSIANCLAIGVSATSPRSVPL